MNSYKFVTQPFTWFLAMLMAVTLVGCGGGGGGENPFHLQ